jgi:deazaflavin-dependent oxidoreductase (nitroreductase family)
MREETFMNIDVQQLADQEYCYLTTLGRRSGRPHTIEIWFASHGQTLYLLSGGREKADWVKNAAQQPEVQLKIGGVVFTGQVRFVDNGQEDALARKVVYNKYRPRSNDDLEDWSRTSLPIAVDLRV